MTKIGKLIFYGVVFLLIVIVAIITFGVEGTKQIEMLKDSNGVNMGLVVTYILAGIGVLGMIGIAIKGMIEKPKSAIKTLIGFGAILILFLIGYMLDAGATPSNWVQFGVETKGSSKLIGGSLIMMYIALFGGLLIIVAGPLLRFIKK